MPIELEPVRGRGAPESTPNTAPHVLIRADRRARDPIGVAAPRTAWRLFGWFGLLLVVIGLIDVVSPWYPASFENRVWQFNAAAATIASLPLLTVGVTAILASFLARAEREGVIAMGVVFVTLLLFVGAVLLLFGIGAPVALRAGSGVAPELASKTIVLTVILGACYATAYVAAAATSFRYVFGIVKDR